MRSLRAAPVVLGLSACVTFSEVAETEAAPVTGAARTVMVEGQMLEVERILARFLAVAPGAAGVPADDPEGRPGESPDGEPAIAVAGLTRGPGAYDLAYFAILSACDIGTDEAGRDAQRFGIVGDLALWSPEDPGTLLIPMRYCPALDDA